jgi:hypothetical protein
MTLFLQYTEKQFSQQTQKKFIKTPIFQDNSELYQQKLASLIKTVSW